MRYSAAEIDATVKVKAYELNEDRTRRAAMREVTISFQEQFGDDAELDRALEAFAASVREAARR